MSALSSKISSVLSNSYADLEIRDALATLDSRGIKNSPETRRNLRLDVQKEIIDCNAEVLTDFGVVATYQREAQNLQQLKRTGEALVSLQQTCAELRNHITSTRTEAASVIGEVNNLAQLKSEVESKQRLLEDLDAHFVLSDREQYILTSSADPVTDDFFIALSNAKRIHRDSRVLLGSDNQRLGLEILGNSAKLLESAFQRLFRWIQRELKTLDLENPIMGFSMRRALRLMAERPALFQDCLDTFAGVRERSLYGSFYTALTGRSTEGDKQKPIEFSAHEPLRYVGDMLAWVHSAAVSERESLEVLFISEGSEIAKSIEEGLESEPWSRPESGESFDGRKALGQLVNRNLAGVAQVLRQRVEQVINTHQEADLEYKIANLVSFYRNIFQKLLEDDEFLLTLDALETAALHQFRTNMHIQLAQVKAEESYRPADLGEPKFLNEGLAQLRQLLNSYDTSAGASDGKGEALNMLLQEALDPFLGFCEELSKTLEPPANMVFSVNCFLAAKSALSSFSFAEARLAELNQSVQNNVAGLVKYQHGDLLTKSGLYPLISALGELPGSGKDAAETLAHEAFRSEKLAEAQQQLDNFLPSALMDASEALSSIKSSSISHEVTMMAVEQFCSDFEELEAAICAADQLQRDRLSGEDSDSDAQTLRTLFPRTNEEIRILLS